MHSTKQKRKFCYFGNNNPSFLILLKYFFSSRFTIVGGELRNTKGGEVRDTIGNKFVGSPFVLGSGSSWAEGGVLHLSAAEVPCTAGLDSFLAL